MFVVLSDNVMKKLLLVSSCNSRRYASRVALRANDVSPIGNCRDGFDGGENRINESSFSAITTEEQPPLNYAKKLEGHIRRRG